MVAFHSLQLSVMQTSVNFSEFSFDFDWIWFSKAYTSDLCPFNVAVTFNKQVSKEVVNELKFGDIAVMQI